MRKVLIKLLSLVLMLSAVMCLTIGCKHEHAFDKQVTSSKFVVREATCLEVAVYYYSCSCGEAGEETFEYGEPLGHDFSAWESNSNNTHTRICSRDESHTETGNCSGGTRTCAQKAVCETCETEYGTTDAHVFDQQIVSDTYKYRSATCTAPAKYYYSCECGAKGTTTFNNGEALGHDWRPWSKSYLAGSVHGRTCYRCSDGYESQACSGGTATCTDKAICDVCKTAYGTPLGHSWSAWTSNGDDTHSRVGSRDGSHVETLACSGGDAP